MSLQQEDTLPVPSQQFILLEQLTFRSETQPSHYFKHLIMYEDGHFAKHPQFRFYALKTEMRWGALRIYIQQYSGDYKVVSACANWFNFKLVFILFELTLQFEWINYRWLNCSLIYEVCRKLTTDCLKPIIRGRRQLASYAHSRSRSAIDANWRHRYG